MNVLVRTNWDLVLRVTICYLIFYAALYFLISFINGLSITALVIGNAHAPMGADPAAIIWLKFCGDLAARLGAAALLVHLGVPRYRFALLQDGSLYTGFAKVFPSWLLPMFVLACSTIMGLMVPVLSSYLAVWLLFHFAVAFGMFHYLMHRDGESKRLRLVEEQ